MSGRWHPAAARQEGKHVMQRNIIVASLGLAFVAGFLFVGPSSALAENAKVEICHIPPDNPYNFHTITVSENALEAHLAHGDFKGLCNACGDPAGGPLFDLSASVFKPYNSLLAANTGTGVYDTDCAVPDLSGNLGANLTGITDNCLIIEPPDISGCILFEETSPGNFDVTGEQALSFTVDVEIAAVFRVEITNNSVITFSGTGTGALPGTIALDLITMPFNINAVASGITNCKATNTATMEDVSDSICPLAGLMGGDNALPFPGDPGMRTFPPLTIGADTFELGAGPADPSGWYLSNPAPLAGNGTQWVALAGVLRL
jgi:hypothetical protein